MSPDFWTCSVLTSAASPSRIAPLGASAKTLARVVPLGRTKNSTLADAAAASTMSIPVINTEITLLEKKVAEMHGEK